MFSTAVTIFCGLLINCFIFSKSLDCSSKNILHESPVIASNLLIPAAIADSEIILKCQICDVLSTWVPPHNSIDFPNFTVLTVSPYFSPNRAIAPSERAFSIKVFRFSSNKRFSFILEFTNSSICEI